MDTENQSPTKRAVTFGLSLALCSLLNAALVIAKESSKTVTNWMQRLTGHHWVTHVALVFIVYFAAAWAISRIHAGAGPRLSAQRLLQMVLGGVIGGVLIILCFYLVAD